MRCDLVMIVLIDQAPLADRDAAAVYAPDRANTRALLDIDRSQLDRADLRRVTIDRDRERVTAARFDRGREGDELSCVRSIERNDLAHRQLAGRERSRLVER